MKTRFFKPVILAFIAFIGFTGCVEHRYYHEHHYHRQGWHNHHHHAPPPGINVEIHN